MDTGVLVTQDLLKVEAVVCLSAATTQLAHLICFVEQDAYVVSLISQVVRVALLCKGPV